MKYLTFIVLLAVPGVSFSQGFYIDFSLLYNENADISAYQDRQKRCVPVYDHRFCYGQDVYKAYENEWSGVIEIGYQTKIGIYGAISHESLLDSGDQGREYYRIGYRKYFNLW